jgi:hypothetical protein
MQKIMKKQQMSHDIQNTLLTSFINDADNVISLCDQHKLIKNDFMQMTIIDDDKNKYFITCQHLYDELYVNMCKLIAYKHTRVLFTTLMTLHINVICDDIHECCNILKTMINIL